MPELREWLREGPYTLALSSGFFGFYAHAGAVAALLEIRAPVRWTGSSAGAVVAGAHAAGVGVDALREALVRLRKDDIWDPGIGPGYLRGRRLVRLLERLLPVARIEDCPTPLAISAFDLKSRRTRALTRGPLATAIAASCAVPVLFQPQWIAGRPLLDGGLLDGPGLAGASGRVLVHALGGLAVSEGPDTRVLRLDGLPAVGPDRLENGPRAYEAAFRAATAS